MTAAVALGKKAARPAACAIRKPSTCHGLSHTASRGIATANAKAPAAMTGPSPTRSAKGPNQKRIRMAAST